MATTRPEQPVEALLPEHDEDLADPGLFLHWSGRRQSRLAVPTPRILEEVPDQSDHTDEDPGNLVIEGDNRQALVSLMAQYRGRVDVALIDPPYNTGNNDLRYSDRRFSDPDADADDAVYVTNVDGRRHTGSLGHAGAVREDEQDDRNGGGRRGVRPAA